MLTLFGANRIGRRFSRSLALAALLAGGATACAKKSSPEPAPATAPAEAKPPASADALQAEPAPAAPEPELAAPLQSPVDREEADQAEAEEKATRRAPASRAAPPKKSAKPSAPQRAKSKAGAGIGTDLLDESKEDSARSSVLSAAREIETKFEQFTKAIQLSTPDCASASGFRDRICELAEQICRLAEDSQQADELAMCVDGRNRCAEARRRFDDQCAD